jgi:hypothetical protein
MASLRPIEANRLNSLHRCAIAPVPAKPSPTRITASGIPPHPVERDLVDILVRTTWLLRRLDRVEDQAWQDQLHRDRRAPSRANIRWVRAREPATSSSCARRAASTPASALPQSAQRARAPAPQARRRPGTRARARSPQPIATQPPADESSSFHETLPEPISPAARPAPEPLPASVAGCPGPSKRR